MMKIKNKKIKMKAITPVIALVMLLLITVGIVGVSYAWIGGLITSSTSNAIAIPPGGSYCDNGDIKVYVVNNGEDTITTDDIIVADVDGVSVLNTPFFGDMSSDLVGYWKFDELSGAVAMDSSGNDNDGDLVNDPEWVIGKSRNALKFDGTNDYVSISDDPSLNNIGDAITISVWFKRYGGNANGWNEDVVQKASRDAWIVDITPARQVQVYAKIDGSSRIVGASSAGDITNDVWENVVAVYDSTSRTGRVYVNGVQKGYTILSGLNSYTLNPVTGGVSFSNSAGYHINGIIDEAKIYNKASADVNIQPAQSDLVVSYPGIEGKHIVRIGTVSGIVETGVTCA